MPYLKFAGTATPLPVFVFVFFDSLLGTVASKGVRSQRLVSRWGQACKRGAPYYCVRVLALGEVGDNLETFPSSPMPGNPWTPLWRGCNRRVLVAQG